jgi:hypothetical protein
MHCSGDLDTRVRLLVQRQFPNPSAIELLFERVVTFHLQPRPQNYDSIIFEATVLLDADVVYWADTSDWTYTSENRDSSIWVAAPKVSWRDASEWMGDDLHYGALDPH